MTATTEFHRITSVTGVGMILTVSKFNTSGTVKFLLTRVMFLSLFMQVRTAKFRQVGAVMSKPVIMKWNRICMYKSKGSIRYVNTVPMSFSHDMVIIRTSGTNVSYTISYIFPANTMYTSLHSISVSPDFMSGTVNAKSAKMSQKCSSNTILSEDVSRVLQTPPLS